MNKVDSFRSGIEELIREGEITWAEGIKMYRAEFGLGLSACFHLANKWKAIQKQRAIGSPVKQQEEKHG